MSDEVLNALRQLTMFIPKEYLGWNESELSIPNVSFDSAGGACPVQAEGTYRGYKFYFRFRWGTASLSLSKDDPIRNPEYDVVDIISDDMNGFLTKNEFVESFNKLLKQIDSEIDRGNK